MEFCNSIYLPNGICICTASANVNTLKRNYIYYNVLQDKHVIKGFTILHTYITITLICFELITMTERKLVNSFNDQTLKKS